MNLTQQICEALIECHRRRGWRAEKEALFSPRRIDVLAISPQGREVVAFEIKTSRADFRMELRQPSKREAVMRYCTQFYFVTPVGLVSEAEVPNNSGLVYFNGFSLEVVKTYLGRYTELVLEIDLREQWKRWNRIHDDARAFRICDLERNGESEDGIELSEYCQFPKWWRGVSDPPTTKPIRFQFDVTTAAEKLCGISVDESVIDFERIPF